MFSKEVSSYSMELELRKPRKETFPDVFPKDEAGFIQGNGSRDAEGSSLRKEPIDFRE